MSIYSYDTKARVIASSPLLHYPHKLYIYSMYACMYVCIWRLYGQCPYNDRLKFKDKADHTYMVSIQCMEVTVYAHASTHRPVFTL